MSLLGALHDQLEQTVQILGYKSVHDFALNQAINQLGRKISYYQSRVDFYEQKYGMNYESFSQRVVNQEDPVLKRFGIIEKEDDDFEWEDALYFVGSYTEKLHALGS